MGDLLPERRPERVAGEVMSPVYIEVRQEGGAWRLFPSRRNAPKLLRDGREVSHGQMLSSGGRPLGGTREQAIRDAERVALSHGFIFDRTALPA